MINGFLGHAPEQDPAQVLGDQAGGDQEARARGGSTRRGQRLRVGRQAGALQVHYFNTKA